MGRSITSRRHAIAPALVAAVAAIVPPQATLGQSTGLQSEPSRIPVQAALPLLPAQPAAPLLSNSPSQAQLPSFLDDRRLREIESAREASEAEIKRKAEAERQRLADEERKRLAEEEAKRKADEMRQKVADEAEERRKARKMTRQLEKMREDAQANSAQKAAEPQAPAAADAPASIEPKPKHVVATMTIPATAAAGGAAVGVAPVKPGNCGAAKFSTVALPAGRMSIAIEAPCRAGETAKINYGAYSFHIKLDEKGQRLHVLDLFQGAGAPVSVAIGDDTAQALTVETHDLDKVSKVAIVWSAPVDLDLHALEYTATRDGEGHIWSAKPSSVETVVQRARDRNRGAGFMSTVGDGKADGHKLEVYTFWHVGPQEPGVVALAVDYLSRGAMPDGDYCGTGTLAEVAYEAVVFSKGRVASRERSALGSAACGKPMVEDARYNTSAVPHLKVQ